MKTETKQKMYQAIQEHGESLNRIFNTGLDPVKLCRKLFRLENKAHYATTCLCNTNTLNLMELNRWTGYAVKQATEDEQDAFFDKIRKSLVKILGDLAPLAIHINYDARGYALKIKPESIKRNNWKIYQDWGGNGILAPDFRN